jgi:hypothetical protein
VDVRNRWANGLANYILYGGPPSGEISDSESYQEFKNRLVSSFQRVVMSGESIVVSKKKE